MSRVSKGKLNYLKVLYGCMHPVLWPYVNMYQREADRLGELSWIIPANFRNVDMTQYKGY